MRSWQSGRLGTDVASRLDALYRLHRACVGEMDNAHPVARREFKELVRWDAVDIAIQKDVAVAEEEEVVARPTAFNFADGLNGLRHQIPYRLDNLIAEQKHHQGDEDEPNETAPGSAICRDLTNDEAETEERDRQKRRKEERAAKDRILGPGSTGHNVKVRPGCRPD